MGTREDIRGIRIVNVTKRGKDPAFSSIGDKLQCLSPDGFVAIDTEFSGLGTDEKVKDDNLEVRYAALRRLADTRAIFSVGISIFNPVPLDEEMKDATSNEDVEGSEKDDVLLQRANANGSDSPPSSDGSSRGDKRFVYEVATYDLLMRCEDEFELNANSGSFLVGHGFDFNHMFRSGIAYERASTEKLDKASDAANKGGVSWRWGKWPKGLLWRIGRQAVPLIVHNGLYDLVFLYAAFQGPLPPTLNEFISCLLECMPAGYWDTKVLAGNAQEKASYLGYLFAKGVLNGQVGVRNCTGLPPDSITNPKEDPVPSIVSRELCALFSFRGFCHRGAGCEFSHDPFDVVQEEIEGKAAKDKKEAYKRHSVQSKNLKRIKKGKQDETSKLSKKRRKKLLEGVATAVSNGAVGRASSEEALDRDGASTKPQQSDVPQVGQAHSAGWDAFCTGLVFATYRASLPTAILNKERNRIALTLKLSSLLLCKSQFAALDEVRPGENVK